MVLGQINQLTAAKSKVRALYQFAMIAVTNYYKFSGLKQYKFILLQFWSPEVQNYGTQSKVRARPLFSEALGQKPFLSFSSFHSSIPCIPWLLTPFSILQGNSLTSLNLSALCSHCLLPVCVKSPSPPSCEDTCEYIQVGTTQIIQDNLITSAKSLFPYKVIFRVFRNQDLDIYWRSSLSLTQSLIHIIPISNFQINYKINHKN